MDIKSLDDTIDWQNDCKTKIKKNINEFCNAGVSLDVKDNKGERTPLHYAAEYCSSDVVALLISCGALTALRGKDDWAPLHFAVRGNKPDNVKCLLRYSVSGVENLKDKWGRTALDLAAHDGKTDIVKILCDFNPNLINKQNNYGWAALHYAAFYNYEEMLDYLIEHGANLNIKTNKEKTPLNLAIKYHWHECSIIRKLIERGTDVKGQSDALNWAVGVRDKKMVEKLLGLGAVPDNETLVHAVSQEQIQIVKIFLDGYPDIVNLQEDGPLKHAPLHVAVLKDNPKIVKMLIERGADVDLKDSVGRTPFYMAMKVSKNPEIIKLFKNADKIRVRYLKRHPQVSIAPKTLVPHNDVKVEAISIKHTRC